MSMLLIYQLKGNFVTRNCHVKMVVMRVYCQYNFDAVHLYSLSTQWKNKSILTKAD